MYWTVRALHLLTNEVDHRRLPTSLTPETVEVVYCNANFDIHAHDVNQVTIMKDMLLLQLAMIYMFPLESEHRTIRL